MKVVAHILAVLVAAGVILFGPFAFAQTYPEKAVSLVVPYPAGGSTDLVARIVGRTLAKELGQPVVVENAPGAAGMIGMNKVAQAKPDGYTLGLGLNGPMTIVPYMMKEPLYDPAKAFVPLGLIATSSYLMIARPDLGVGSLADLIAKAGAAPGKYTYGSIGIGSSTHLLTELVMSAARIDLLHVPYKGEAETIRALMRSEIDVTWVTVQSGAPLVADGKAKGVFVTGRDRVRSLPAVLTASESGRPDLTVETFFGLLAPAGTAQPIIDRLDKALAKRMSDPECIAALEKMGLHVASGGPDDFGALLERHQRAGPGILHRAISGVSA